ncbi:MAG: hypothetical protein HYX67_00380 [Candidatus Melainabacteria bacterium]|nr:hypothetical protein [Candidatus Melainabacteria bacterium]
MNLFNRGFDLTSTGLTLALLCGCLGVAYNFVDHGRQDARYGQMMALGSPATADELKHDPLLRTRALHSMLWVYKKAN